MATRQCQSRKFPVYLEMPSYLLDPWGRQFQIGMIGKSDEEIYYVWTISPFGGGKKRITSLPERKK